MQAAAATTDRNLEIPKLPTISSLFICGSSIKLAPNRVMCPILFATRDVQLPVAEPKLNAQGIFKSSFNKDIAKGRGLKLKSSSCPIKG
jgi:hypothetical protein